MSPNNPVSHVYISPPLKSLKKRKAEFINVWRGYPGNWLCTSYKQTANNLRRARMLAAALEARETRRADA